MLAVENREPASIAIAMPIELQFINRKLIIHLCPTIGRSSRRCARASASISAAAQVKINYYIPLGFNTIFSGIRSQQPTSFVVRFELKNLRNCCTSSVRRANTWHSRLSITSMNRMCTCVHTAFNKKINSQRWFLFQVPSEMWDFLLDPVVMFVLWSMARPFANTRSDEMKITVARPRPGLGWAGIVNLMFAKVVATICEKNVNQQFEYVASAKMSSMLLLPIGIGERTMEIEVVVQWKRETRADEIQIPI